MRILIFSLQVGLTYDVVPYCPSDLYFWQFKIMTPLFSLTVPNFYVFSGYWIGNLMKIPKSCLKQSFSHSKWVLQAILSLDVLSNCLFDSLYFDPAFFSDTTKLCSVFFCHWIENLMRNPKMGLKQVISSLQVGFTGNLIPDWQVKF